MCTRRRSIATTGTVFVLAALAACSSGPSYLGPDTSPEPDSGQSIGPRYDAAAEQTDAASPDAGPVDLGPGGAFRMYADNGAAGLHALYSNFTGLYPSTGWWNSANALTAIIDYSARTGLSAYLGDIGQTFDKNSSKNFLNDFYDDEGWWALAWIDAFDLTKDARYLAMAKTIFDDMKGAWDDTCGGGTWWKKDRKYKNAIANELFFEIAVRLHQRTPGDAGAGSYIDWAEREWAWFEQSGMINADHLVNDGLDECKNNGQTTWTYNQGVLIGALTELAKETGKSALLDEAEAIANASMSKLVNDQGVLRESCEPSCGNDGPQFKGIFMRNFAVLADARPSPDKVRFITHNADWLWNAARRGTNADTRFGLNWSEAFDSGDAARQASALDLLNVALAYDAPEDNLAIGKTVKSTAPCNDEEAAALAVDGDVSTKWCGVPTGAMSLEVDLGASTDVGRIIVRHAGAGGEKAGWNTKDFSLRSSDDGTTWADVTSVTSNTRAVTIHRLFPARPARFVRLEITAPQSASDAVAARIDEIEIYAR